MLSALNFSDSRVCKLSLSSILDQYGSIWSGGVSSSYSYNTNPNNLSTSSTLYQSGQSYMTTHNTSNLWM